MHVDPFDVRPIERTCICAPNGHGHSDECNAAYRAKLLDGKAALREAFERRRRAGEN